MIATLQYLRGIAALMVVYHHVGYQLNMVNGARLPLVDVGAAGVDIFFVLSGFIMARSLADHRGSPARFLYRRFVRIAPLYWSATLLLLLISIAAPSLLHATHYAPGHVFASLLFVPVEHPVLHGEILPYLIQGWTLNYEVFFYGLLALSMVIPRPRAVFFVLATLIVLAGAGLRPAGPASVRFYETTLVLEFAMGLLGAHLFFAGHQVAFSHARWAIALGVLALITSGLLGFGFDASGRAPERVVVWGIPSAALVIGAAHLNRFGIFETELWLRLGASSFALYLSHGFVLPVARMAWTLVGFSLAGIGQIAFVVFAMTLAATIGWYVHTLVERPMTRALQALPGHLKSSRAKRLKPVR